MNTRDAWRNIGSPEFYSNSSTAYSNYNNFRYKKMFRDTRDRISGKNKSIAIISDRPKIVGYLLDQPVYQFPDGQLNNSKVEIINEKAKNGAIMLVTSRSIFAMYKSYGSKLEGLDLAGPQKFSGFLVIKLPLPVLNYQ